MFVVTFFQTVYNRRTYAFSYYGRVKCIWSHTNIHIMMVLLLMMMLIILSSMMREREKEKEGLRIIVKTNSARGSVHKPSV